MGALLIVVMGPSGVGKDTLLRGARALMAGGAVQFAHRYITRPAHGDENFISLTPAEFEARRARGLLALDWRAHGFSYGIGAEIELWRQAGCAVVINGSRGHFAAALAGRTDVRPVLISAPLDAIAARLRRRGRDNEAEIAERLARATGYQLEHPALVRIDNDGSPEIGAEKLAAALRALAG